MIYITGDTHGGFMRVVKFCNISRTTKEDVLIILGDACINLFCDGRDTALKQLLDSLPITLLCIHGNHEKRPERIGTYRELPWHGGQVFAEEAYPSLLFAKDGEIYDLDGVETLVVGGAYSVDRARRTENKDWWADEQPSPELKRAVEATLAHRGWRVDAVLTHTAPLKYEPVEMFLPFIDQSKVDKTTEVWLDTIEDRLSYDRWFCGHYHTDKRVDRMIFMLLAIEPWLELNGRA